MPPFLHLVVSSHLDLEFHSTLSIDDNTLSTTESLTISGNRTLVSPGGVFELGFFKPSALPRWYLGLWYTEVSEKAYAWVANRDNPLSSSIGTLKISGNNLVLLGESNNSVWSTNLTRGNVRSPVVAELLHNGNFVMRYSNNSPSGFLWQSFDFPTDTLLPEMKLGYDRKTGRNMFLTSWRSEDDPSSGNFTYKLDTRRGLPEFSVLKNDLEICRSGPWNGIEFSGIPKAKDRYYMVYNYAENSEEVTYTFLISVQSIYSRLTIDNSGHLDLFAWIPSTSRWRALSSLPADDCDYYNYCGSNAYCDRTTTTRPTCNCFEGFYRMILPQWQGSGLHCVRRTPLSCSGNKFLLLKQMKLPDTKMANVDRSIDLKKCEKRCLSDCKCTSFAAADVRNGGTGCLIWRGELNDTRTYSLAGQDLFVKIDALDIDEERDRNGNIIGWSIGVSLMLMEGETEASKRI